MTISKTLSCILKCRNEPRDLVRISRNVRRLPISHCNHASSRREEDGPGFVLFSFKAHQSTRGLHLISTPKPLTFRLRLTKTYFRRTIANPLPGPGLRLCRSHLKVALEGTKHEATALYAPCPPLSSSAPTGGLRDHRKLHALA